MNVGIFQAVYRHAKYRLALALDPEISAWIKEGREEILKIHPDEAHTKELALKVIDKLETKYNLDCSSLRKEVELKWNLLPKE